MRFTAILTILALTPVLCAADKKLPPLDPAAAARVSFHRDVRPILERHCLGCHAGAKPKGKLSLESVAAMRKGGRNGPIFKDGKPDESLLIEVLTGPEPSMPQKEPPLSMDRVQVLRHWILAGARDDSPVGAGTFEAKAPATYQAAPAVTSVALSPDGKLLAAACRSEVVLVDVDGKAAPRRLATTCDLITHVAFSPDGKVLAAAGGAPGRFGEAAFYNPATGQLLSRRRVGKDTLFRGSFAPDGKTLALGGPDGAVHVIPVEAKEQEKHFELHSDWIVDVAWTPDGKYLITAGRDRTTKIASAQTGALLRTLDTTPDRLGAAAADGLSAIAAGRSGAPIAYDLKIALSGIETQTDKNTPLTRRDQYARPFEGQGGEVLSLAVSGDRKLLATAGRFGEVRVYRMDNRQRVAQAAQVPAPIYAVALDGKGTRLALGSKSGLVQVYALPAGKLVRSLVPVPVSSAAATK